MTIWFTSDTHFGHANILTFQDGEKKHVRPGFSCVEEMDERLVENWNACVKPGHKVWHLGDVAMGAHRENLSPIMARLNGSKRLCIGNHDDVKGVVASGAFHKIQLWRMFSDHGFTCSHIPLPPDQFRYKTKVNVHGHIHEKPDPSEHHLNICVERTEYRPIHLDEILKIIKDRGL